MECLNESSTKFEDSDEYEIEYERPFTTETIGDDTEDNLGKISGEGAVDRRMATYCAEGTK
jgi:hypothetical protein